VPDATDALIDLTSVTVSRRLVDHVPSRPHVAAGAPPSLLVLYNCPPLTVALINYAFDGDRLTNERI